jgi:hypothetical protein
VDTVTNLPNEKRKRADIEVYKVLCFWKQETTSANSSRIVEPLGLTVRDIAPKVLSYDNVPSGAVAPVELALDVRCNVLFDAEFIQRGGRNVNRLLLHVFGHVYVLDDCFGAILGGITS